LDIDVLILLSSRSGGTPAARDRSRPEPAKIENRIGLVNSTAVSIHHVVNRARFRLVAFIFGERKGPWLIVGMQVRETTW
jgi:hypothetical protein